MLNYNQWSHKQLNTMPVIDLEPSKDFTPPYDTSPDKPDNWLDELAVAANTAELQVALGASLELDEEDTETQKALIESAIKEKKTSALTNINTAFAASAFLKTYGQQLALDVATVRSAITHKLMEIANCGDPRYELKALELLGKHSDVGLFTERSELTVNYKNPAELEKAIKERISNLLNAKVIDVTPFSASLDDELGIAGVDYPLTEEQMLENQKDTEETEENTSV